MTMYSESLRAFLKPVLPYLDDPAVTEIMINGPEDVWIEKKGKLSKTDARFTEEGLIGAARNMAQFVGRPLSDERPRLDARLPDGSRIHVVIPPIARKGTTIAIRKFFKDKLSIDALLNFGSMNVQMARLVDAVIHTKLNVVVSGGTGSGKTTLLNIVSSLIPDDERILVIEDSAELQLNQIHLVNFESRPPDKFGKGAVDMGELLHSALRLRPDRIIVGEVRGGEAFHLVQAMNTGHGGSLCTTHANTPTDTLRRIEALCLMSSVELPMVAVRAQVASALNLVVCCERLQDGSRKVTAISEVLPLNEKGEYRTQDLFVFTPVGKDADGNIIGYHAPTGIIPNFAARARAYGYEDLTPEFFDPKTYGVPPPPSFAHGEAVQVHWAPSLKHREKGLPDPESYEEAFLAFEAELKRKVQSERPAPQKPMLLEMPEPASHHRSSPSIQRPDTSGEPASHHRSSPSIQRPDVSGEPASQHRSSPSIARPRLTPQGRPAVKQPASQRPTADDLTPLPSRPPLSRAEAPVQNSSRALDPDPDEPKVEIADDLLNEAEAAMVEEAVISEVDTGIRPAPALAQKRAPAAVTKPAPQVPRRALRTQPSAQVDEELIEDDESVLDAPPEANDKDKTRIRPMPPRPRR